MQPFEKIRQERITGIL